MARNFNYAPVFPEPVPGYPEYVQPGFVITRHDENGAIQETLRGNVGQMSQGQFMRLPGPPLDMVAVPETVARRCTPFTSTTNMTDRTICRVFLLSPEHDLPERDPHYPLASRRCCWIGVH